MRQTLVFMTSENIQRIPIERYFKEIDQLH